MSASTETPDIDAIEERFTGATGHAKAILDLILVVDGNDKTGDLGQHTLIDAASAVHRAVCTAEKGFEALLAAYHIQQQKEVQA